MKKKTVLFICSFNSVRSQIAEGLLNARCKNRYTVFSAGIAPAGLNPYAVAVMKEAGIDISAQKSKQLSQFSGIRFDYVITMCDRAKLAVPRSIPKGETMIHRGFVSPLDIRERRKFSQISGRSGMISMHGYLKSSRIAQITGNTQSDLNNDRTSY